MSKKTNEEKVAVKMIDLVNDMTLDLDMVGRYLGETAPLVLTNRITIVADTARQQKAKQIDRINKHMGIDT
jgi:hypothetical protein